MYCKKCGAELLDGARFCTRCGCDQLYSSTAPSPVTPPRRPDNYMWLSVLVTILCCMPLGIVGLLYSSKVDSSWYAGDVESARVYSSKAKSWSLWGIVLMVLFWVLYIGIFVCALGWETGVFTDLFTDIFPENYTCSLVR